MRHSSTYQEEKAEAIRLIRDAIPSKIKDADVPSDRPRSAVVSFLLFILCLLGTTIPHANLNTFFSIAAIISGLVWFHLWWRSGRRFAFSDKLKIGDAQDLGIAGFGPEDVTPQAAMQNGNIQKAIGTQELRSYALVSMVKIRVYGE